LPKNQGSYSTGVSIQFKNEEDCAAFHSAVQQWIKENNVQGAALYNCVDFIVGWLLMCSVFLSIFSLLKNLYPLTCMLVQQIFFLSALIKNWMYGLSQGQGKLANLSGYYKLGSSTSEFLFSAKLLCLK
jgi:hypothetical protein